MKSLNHICSQGQTWGYLANLYYGSMKGIKTLIAANPDVPIDTVLPYGTTLIVPIVENTDSALIITKLPPWKN
jgi:hypothetical protein